MLTTTLSSKFDGNAMHYYSFKDKVTDDLMSKGVEWVVHSVIREMRQPQDGQPNNEFVKYVTSCELALSIIKNNLGPAPRSLLQPILDRRDLNKRQKSRRVLAKLQDTYQSRSHTAVSEIGICCIVQN